MKGLRKSRSIIIIVIIAIYLVACHRELQLVLGPLLFIIFINDFLELEMNTCNKLIICADDTAIHLTEQTIDALFYEATKMLNIVYVWFCKNKLKLNLIK